MVKTKVVNHVIPRHIQIKALYDEGFNTKTIAKQLKVSERTVTRDYKRYKDENNIPKNGLKPKKVIEEDTDKMIDIQELIDEDMDVPTLIVEAKKKDKLKITEDLVEKWIINEDPRADNGMKFLQYRSKFTEKTNDEDDEDIKNEFNNMLKNFEETIKTDDANE